MGRNVSVSAKSSPPQTHLQEVDSPLQSEASLVQVGTGGEVEEERDRLIVEEANEGSKNEVEMKYTYLIVIHRQ